MSRSITSARKAMLQERQDVSVNPKPWCKGMSLIYVERLKIQLEKYLQHDRGPYVPSEPFGDWYISRSNALQTHWNEIPFPKPDRPIVPSTLGDELCSDVTHEFSGSTTDDPVLSKVDASLRHLARTTKNLDSARMWTVKRRGCGLSVHPDLAALVSDVNWADPPSSMWAIECLDKLAATLDDTNTLLAGCTQGSELCMDVGDVVVQVLVVLDSVRQRRTLAVDEDVALEVVMSKAIEMLASPIDGIVIRNYRALAGIVARLSWSRFAYPVDLIDDPMVDRGKRKRSPLDPQRYLLTSFRAASRRQGDKCMSRWLQLLPAVMVVSIGTCLEVIQSLALGCPLPHIMAEVKKSVGELQYEAVMEILIDARTYDLPRHRHIKTLTTILPLVPSEFWMAFSCSSRPKGANQPIWKPEYGGESVSEVIVLAPSMIGAMPLSQYGRDRVEISKIQDVISIIVESCKDEVLAELCLPATHNQYFLIHAEWSRLKCALTRFGHAYESIDLD